MTRSLEGSALGQLRALLDGLDPDEGDALAADLLRIARQGWHRRPVGPAQRGGNPAVVLCDWAVDAGVHGTRQRIETDLSPGSVKIAKTAAATGEQLLSNGFLGADVIHVPAGEGFAPHTHPGDHLLFVIGGRGTITASGEIQETVPGQVYLVDGAFPHAVGAITDHVLLSIGAPHRSLDSEERQELRPFADLLGPDGSMTCRICAVSARGVEAFAATNCPHSPLLLCR